MESRLTTVQVESEQWTVHSPHQTQVEKKNPLPSPNHKKKKGGPSLNDPAFHWVHGNSIPKIGRH